MKRILNVSAIMVLILMLIAGCGNSATSESAGNNESGNSGEQLRIGFVMKTLSNPFWLQVEKGAEEAAEEFNVELDVQAGQEETSIEQQVKIIEDMIAKKMDAIVVAPIGSKEIVPVLKKAQDAGIAVLHVDNQISAEAMEEGELDPVPYVGASNTDGGYMAAKYLAEQLNGEGQIAILEGIPGVDQGEQRKQGALKAFEEFDGLEVVASQAANFAMEEGMNVAANMIQANPNLDAIFAANDMMALGAIQAIQSAGKTGEILVTGYDGSDEAKQAVKDGTLLSTLDQKPNLMGYYGVKNALDLIEGKEVEMEYLVDIVNVTKDNIDK